MQHIQHIRWLLVLMLATVLGAVAVVVYRAALTPAAVARWDARPSAVDWNSVHDDPAVTLDLSWLGPPLFANGRAGSLAQRTLEKRFNVRITPIFMDGGTYQSKKSLLFAGGDVPDLFWDLDPLLLQRDVFHGFVLEIPYDVLLRHAPTTVSFLNRTAPVGWLYAQWKGRNYGVPTSYLGGGNPTPGLWRVDWLRNVGIDRIPKTLEEMHEALRRFTFNDPDRNGHNDTYGMSGDVQVWWWVTFGDVFGAYGVIPYDWMERDGKAVFGGILPEAKAALTCLRAWCAEGIIDPEFLTDRYQGTLERKFQNGRFGYLFASASRWAFDLDEPKSMASIMRQLNPAAEIAPGHFPIGPTGYRGSRAWGTGGHIIAFGRHLEKHPEKVLRVLRMLDTIATDRDLYMLTKYGVQGVHWDYRVPDTGQPGTGPDSGIVRLPPYDDQNVFNRDVIGGFFNPCMNPEFEDACWARREREFRDTWCRAECAMTDLFGKPDCVPSAGKYMAELRSRQMTVYAEIIRGTKPLSAFDEFVTEWKARGGAQMTREANDLLVTMKSIYRRVGVTP